MKFAHILEEKGSEAYAIERIAKEITDLGYSKVVLNEDQEPAIKSLREAVIRRINAIKGDVNIQVITEESPVGGSVLIRN